MLPYNHPTVLCAQTQGLSARFICKSGRRINPLAVLTSDRRKICKGNVWWWLSWSLPAGSDSAPLPVPPQQQWQPWGNGHGWAKHICWLSRNYLEQFLPVAINLLFADLFYAELAPQAKLSGSMQNTSFSALNMFKSVEDLGLTCQSGFSVSFFSFLFFFFFIIFFFPTHGNIYTQVNTQNYAITH